MGFACRVATATGTHSEYLLRTIDNSSMKYSISCEPRKANPFLHFCGNSEHFYVVNSYIYADSNKKGNVLLRFHGNSGYVNAPQCNVCTKTLSASSLRYIEGSESHVAV